MVVEGNTGESVLGWAEQVAEGGAGDEDSLVVGKGVDGGEGRISTITPSSSACGSPRRDPWPLTFLRSYRHTSSCIMACPSVSTHLELGGVDVVGG